MQSRVALADAPFPCRQNRLLKKPVAGVIQGGVQGMWPALNFQNVESC